MSISPRTPRFSNEFPKAGIARRAMAGLGAVATLMASQACEGQAPALECTVRVPSTVTAGAPIPMSVTLRNTGSTAVHLLTWGTPFEEAWLQPFVEVTRDGVPLAYGGATVKRGDPDSDEYLLIGAGAVRTASLDLAEVFPLDRPGRYRVVPRITLHDVVGEEGVTPRLRAAHAAVALACAPVEFDVLSAP